jgi:hypothetical protein
MLEEAVKQDRIDDPVAVAVADLHLEPDMNDGVVLNIAPLWELVPCKVAKQYWDELTAGKYERSAIGKQLREKGMGP